MEKIILIHNGTQIGVVETIRKPHVGARYGDIEGFPGQTFRVRGWTNDGRALVELAKDQPLARSTAEQVPASRPPAVYLIGGRGGL